MKSLLKMISSLDIGMEFGSKKYAILIMNKDVSADPRVKVNESKKLKKYLDPSRELKNVMGH